MRYEPLKQATMKNLIILIVALATVVFFWEFIRLWDYILPITFILLYIFSMFIISLAMKGKT